MVNKIQILKIKIENTANSISFKNLIFNITLFDSFFNLKRTMFFFLGDFSNLIFDVLLYLRLFLFFGGFPKNTTIKIIELFIF